jgi:hypothetical protein
VRGPARSAPEERSPPRVPGAWRHPVWLLLIALGGFLVGVGILLFGYKGTDDSIRFVRSSGFAVWPVVIGAQTAYWAVVSGPLWADLIAVWRHASPGHASTLALAAALILILIVCSRWSRSWLGRRGHSGATAGRSVSSRSSAGSRWVFRRSWASRWSSGRSTIKRRDRSTRTTRQPRSRLVPRSFGSSPLREP